MFEEKLVPLHPKSKSIGIWCNGNTADSGPAFPGSSPGIPTKRNANRLIMMRLAFFILYFSRDFPVILYFYP